MGVEEREVGVEAAASAARTSLNKIFMQLQSLLHCNKFNEVSIAVLI